MESTDMTYPIQEMAIQTETLKKIRAQRLARREKQYVFRLDAQQVQRARELDLPDSALIALAAIDAAAYGSRRNDWVTLPTKTIDAFARGFRWWHRATTKLEQTGLIECQRHSGRLPRYRLKKRGQETRNGCVATPPFPEDLRLA